MVMVLAGEGFLHEDGHGGGVGALGVLARTEDVEEAQRGGVELAFAAEHFEVVFAIELGDGVRALGLGQHGLDLRHVGVVAIDGGGAGEHEFSDAGGGGGFEHVEQAEDVDFDAFARAGHGLGHGDHGGEVEDEVHALHGVIDSGAVGDAAFDEGVGEAVEVVAVAGAEVVEHDDRRQRLGSARQDGCR